MTYEEVKNIIEEQKYYKQIEASYLVTDEEIKQYEDVMEAYDIVIQVLEQIEIFKAGLERALEHCIFCDEEIDCFNKYIEDAKMDIAFGNSDWCNIYHKIVGNKVSEYAKEKMELYQG